MLLSANKWSLDSARKGYLLSVAATHGPRIFEGAVLCAQCAIDALGITYAGEFLVRGVDGRGDMKKDREKIRQAGKFGQNMIINQT